MDKSILVLDKMPENCMECPLRFKDGDTDDWFRFRCIKSTDQIPKEGRLLNCELKSMPHELPTPYMMRQIMIAEGIQTEKPPYTEEYQKGYNDCISEILGEVEDE